MKILILSSILIFSGCAITTHKLGEAETVWITREYPSPLRSRVYYCANKKDSQIKEPVPICYEAEMLGVREN